MAGKGKPGANDKKATASKKESDSKIDDSSVSDKPAYDLFAKN